MISELALRPFRGRLTTYAIEPWVRAIPATLYLGLIYFVSATPGPDLPNVVDDRVAHFTEYSILGVLLLLFATAFSIRGSHFPRFAAVWLFALAWAVSDEFHQSFVPGRDVEVKDVVFDMLGLSFALVVLWLLLRRRSDS
ncbi:MAG: VanZ family protein [Thermoanaerobaculia bacterium]